MTDKPFHKLTPAQVERLEMFDEECKEAGVAKSKIIRHGLESYNPQRTEDGSNHVQFCNEIVDVLATIQIMQDAGDIPIFKQSRIEAVKQGKFAYSHHQGTSHD